MKMMYGFKSELLSTFRAWGYKHVQFTTENSPLSRWCDAVCEPSTCVCRHSTQIFPVLMTCLTESVLVPYRFFSNSPDSMSFPGSKKNRSEASRNHFSLIPSKVYPGKWREKWRAASVVHPMERWFWPSRSSTCPYRISGAQQEQPMSCWSFLEPQTPQICRYERRPVLGTVLVVANLFSFINAMG